MRYGTTSRRILCTALMLPATLALSGCSSDWAIGGPQRAATQPSDDGATAGVDPFAPPPLPADFDPARARLALHQLPEDPPAPAAARAATRPAELPEPARRSIREARRLFDEQRFTETIIEAERALRYEPNLAEGHRLIALASVLSGNESRARLSAERALTLEPDDLACHYVLARSAEKADKGSEAMKHYRSALKCRAGDENRSYLALTHYHLGRMLFANGLYAAAAEQLDAFETVLATLGEKAEQNAELATIARVHRAQAALTAARARAYLGEYAAAADALGRFTARVPGEFEARAEYVRMLVRAKRHDEATQEAAALLADSQGKPEAVQLLVAVYAATGRPERAVAAIKAVVARQPENVDLWLLYIDTLRKAEKLSEAFHAARDLVSRHPESSAAQWKLIELYRARQDWTGWATQLAAYLAAQPDDAMRVRRELGQIPRDAVAPLLTALQTQAAQEQPASDLAASAGEVVRGALLERIEQLEEARKLYDAAIARTPEFTPAALAVGELYLSRCRWKEAIGVLEAAQQQRGRPSAQLAFLLARAHDGLDQIEQATEHYQQAIELDRSSLEPLLALARLLERTGNLAGARKQYEEAIRADAAYMPARERLIHLLLSQLTALTDGRDQQNMLNRALSELAEMQKLAPQDPATQRSAALVQFLISRDRKQYIQTLEKLLTHHPDEQRTREDLFRSLIEAREFESAQRIAREILERDHCSAIGLEMYATTQLRLLRFEEAAVQYQRMLEMYPYREQWLNQYAELLSLIRQYDRAAAAYERLLNLERVRSSAPRQLQVREKLVRVHRRAENYDRARELIEGWLADASDDRTRRVYRSMLLLTDLDAADYERFLARCRQWLESEPGSLQLRQSLVLGLLRSNRRDEAIAQALAWLGEEPDDQRLDWMADVLQAAGQYEGAINIARSLLATADREEARRLRLYELALLLVAAGQHDAAIVTMRELVTQAEASMPEMHLQMQKLLASFYVQADRPEEATRYLNRMLSELNEQLSAMLNEIEQRFRTVMKSVASEEDRRKLERELASNLRLARAAAEPRQSEILRTMYLAYHRQGQIEVAEQRLREALALTPDEPGIYNDLGYSLADTGKDLEEARRLIAVAVSQEPMTHAYLDSYGWVLYKLGQFEEAHKWLEWAAGLGTPASCGMAWTLAWIGWDPRLETDEDPVIADHLGDVRWRLGRRDEAVACWKRALEIHELEMQAGETGAEKDLPERVRRKLAAVAAGQEPPVAPVGTRPAD